MFRLEQLIGKDPSSLVAIDAALSTRQNQLAHPDALTALLELQHLAKKHQQPFKIISSYRSFDVQRIIWNRKFNGHQPVLDKNEQPLAIDLLSEIELIESIMLFTALPGASRHHWGTDFDIFPSAALEAGYQVQLLESEFTGSGIATEFNHWLSEALSLIDFFRPYEKCQGGVASEPWHISYFPIADLALAELTEEQLLTSYQHSALLEDSEIAGQRVICENMASLYKRFISNICKGASH